MARWHVLVRLQMDMVLVPPEFELAPDAGEVKDEETEKSPRLTVVVGSSSPGPLPLSDSLRILPSCRTSIVYTSLREGARNVFPRSLELINKSPILRGGRARDQWWWLKTRSTPFVRAGESAQEWWWLKTRSTELGRVPGTELMGRVVSGIEVR
ncbi:hypothetical protein BDZ97DRAFT_202786 [Flammula alnicola]|nr:hypothetical protein BDZ97DRAFT_202786 [Flammula alnicola]